MGAGLSHPQHSEVASALQCVTIIQAATGKWRSKTAPQRLKRSTDPMQTKLVLTGNRQLKSAAAAAPGSALVISGSWQSAVHQIEALAASPTVGPHPTVAIDSQGNA